MTDTNSNSTAGVDRVFKCRKCGKEVTITLPTDVNVALECDDDHSGMTMEEVNRSESTSTRTYKPNTSDEPSRGTERVTQSPGSIQLIEPSLKERFKRRIREYYYNDSR